MAANITASVAGWSATAASNQPDTTDAADIVSDLRAIQAAVKKDLRNIGANIASASTVDLATATGDFITVTGTTTVTALGTVAAGMRYYLHFSGALTITHNATSLIMPGALNAVTVAGDVYQFESLGSGNWRCCGRVASYTPQEAKIAPTFVNSWGNQDTYTGEDASYWKDSNGNVHLQGQVADGTMGSTIFTLPAGYRPADTLSFVVSSSTGSNAFTVGLLFINSSGEVSASPSYGSNEWITLDGITFRPA